jgi:hypothetical protein
MSRACSTNGGEKKFVGKPKGKSPLGKPKRKWVHIKMGLTMGWYGLN